MNAPATSTLPQTLRTVREAFPRYCEPLSPEDMNLQAAVFASPPKWHLAHTTWFFETFLLKPFLAGYAAPNPAYEVLFNSYYNGIGEQHPRGERGLLSRPALAEVLSWRQQVDDALNRLLEQRDHPSRDVIVERIQLGIEHERQHQELFFTDLLYSLSANPLYPAYCPAETRETAGDLPAPNWVEYPGGLEAMGYEGDGFCFDNERPRHRHYLHPFAIADRLVTNGEYQAFIDDGGYARPELWLADGWTRVCETGWKAPLYWRDDDGEALEFSLYGLRPRDPGAPVCHVSGYEADAFARWSGARLPTEGEWEQVATVAAPSVRLDDLRESSILRPAANAGSGLRQLYGACWQWTQSAYGPYPGFSPAAGAIGEYNGKFMCNQWVLRGGSCVTAASQSRPTYRNFFYPGDRWQFSGIRLARSTSADGDSTA